MTVASVADVSSFVIRELTGPRRTVQLVGRALPYRPFTLETLQRVEIDWYPGNPEATSTILGAAEGTSTLSGTWKTKFLGAADSSGNAAPFQLDGADVTTAKEAVFAMDSIVRAGQVLEVSWDEIVRHGHLTSFEQNWDNVYDIRWTMKFEWISRGEATNPPVFVTTSGVTGTASQLTAAVEDVMVAAQPPADLPVATDSASFAVRVQSGVNRMFEIATKVQGAVSNIAVQATAPIDASRSIVASCTAMIVETNEVMNDTQAQVAGTINDVRPVGEQSFGERLLACSYVREIRASAKRTRTVSLESRDALLNQTNSTLLAIHTSQGDQDLRDVSQIYYSTPHEWRTLMNFNELSSPVLSAGQLVMIPKRTSSDGGSVGSISS